MISNVFFQFSHQAQSCHCRWSCTSISSSQYFIQYSWCLSLSTKVWYISSHSVSPWRSPVPAEYLGSWICDNHLLLFHPSVTSLLWLPCKPYREHILNDPIPCGDPVQHLILYLFQLPHDVRLIDRDDCRHCGHLFRNCRNYPKLSGHSEVPKG